MFCLIYGHDIVALNFISEADSLMFFSALEDTRPHSRVAFSLFEEDTAPR